jgi:alpha-glucosidase
VNNNYALLSGAVVRKVQRRSVNTTITSPVPEKRITIPDVYNELRIDFNRPVSLVFRAYNDGVAYRFETRFQDSLVVQNEQATFRFSPASTVYYGQVQKRNDADLFHTSFEENYTIRPLDSIAQDSLAFTPVLVTEKEAKVVLTESDLEGYPGMFSVGTGVLHLKACLRRTRSKKPLQPASFHRRLLPNAPRILPEPSARVPFHGGCWRLPGAIRSFRIMTSCTGWRARRG